MRELPRYSDQETQFWSTNRQRSLSEPNINMPTIRDDPELKTHPKEHPEFLCSEKSSFQMPSARLRTKKPQKSVLAPKTRIRYHDAIIINKQQADQPRLFDDLPKIPTSMLDHLPIDQQSSFEFIKKSCNRSLGMCRADNNRVHQKALPVSSLSRSVSVGGDRSLQTTLGSQTGTSGQEKSSGGGLMHPRSESRGCKSMDSRSRFESREEAASRIADPYATFPSFSGYDGRGNRSICSRQKTSKEQSVLEAPIQFKTVYRENPKGPDMSMMDRTHKGFYASIRSGGFQRVGK